MINRQTAAMTEQLAATNADVVLLQEYTDAWHAALQQRLGERYPHVVYFPREDSFGSAIYSRYPFEERPIKFLGIGIFDDPQMRAVIRVRGEPIAVYNLHLRPPWGGHDYVVEHQLQFADLLDRLRAEQIPSIVAGDFNFNETTAFARAIGDAGFIDAFDQAGWGRGATWPMLGPFRWLPGIRIDHVYLSRALRCTDIRTMPPCGSDHRSLRVELALAGADAPSGGAGVEDRPADPANRP